MITFQPTAHSPKPWVLAVTHTRTRSAPSVHPTAAASTRSEGNRNTAARRRAGRGEHHARCRGQGAGGLVSGFSAPTAARAGPPIAAGARPAGQAAAARARRRLAGSSSARWGPGAGGSAEGLRPLGPGRKGAPARQTNPGRAASLPPAVPSPRPPPCFSLTLAPRLQSAAGSRLQCRRLGARDWRASPATRAPAARPSSPGAGQGSRQESPEAPGIRASCPDPVTASARREARVPARRRRGPQGAFP